MRGTGREMRLNEIFTARKRISRRLCFYTCLSVILFTGGRGHVWQGGMLGRGCAWQGGVCGRGGVCMACVAGGVHGRGHVWWGGTWVAGVCVAGGHAWQGACVAGHTPPSPQRIWQDMVNERTVCILLECILVLLMSKCICVQCHVGHQYPAGRALLTDS